MGNDGRDESSSCPFEHKSRKSKEKAYAHLGTRDWEYQNIK